jgi:hypothetical protein
MTTQIEALQHEHLVRAAAELRRQQAEIERLNAEVLEQCRINGMSAEREDALRAELTRLKASIALDKKAENARELGLDYEPAVQEPFNHQQAASTALRKSMSRSVAIAKNTVPILQKRPQNCGTGYCSCIECVMEPAAQPPVQEGRDWSLLAATQESLREHMAEIKRLKAAQPAPVQEPVATLFGSLPVYDTTPPAAQPDYAWPTIEDYEKEVGFEVNIAFRSAWAMARTTNDLFNQMGENT